MRAREKKWMRATMSPSQASGNQEPETAVPDAETLAPFPAPWETQRLFGHETAELTLQQALQGERLPHAWLIAGAPGIGKATLAFRFARYVLAGGEQGLAPQPDQGPLFVPPDHPTAQQVARLAHPNLLVLRREKDPNRRRFYTVIRVEDVRKLHNFLGNTPGAGMWRVVVVDSADHLNVSAANALLKMLEEPPAQTVFLLVSASPGRLLATIRSRCRLLRLTPLAPEPLRQAVREACSRADIPPPTESEWEKLLPLAAGQVRRALALHEGGGLAIFDDITALFANLPDLDMTALHSLADRLAGHERQQDFELFFWLLLDELARRLKAAAMGESPRRGLEDWAQLWETIGRLKAETLQLNLDRKQAILDMGFRLAQTAREAGLPWAEPV